VLDLLHLILREQKIAFFTTDSELTILSYVDDAQLLPDAAETLFDYLPELYGCEEILQEVMAGSLPNFELENINRPLPDDSVCYLTLVALAYPLENQQPRLLIMLADKTAWVQVQQVLTQQRNELSLLKHKLDESHKNLEFLLQHYVPREVSKALIEKRIVPKLGGEERRITTLFADLRNFTRISDTQTPNETIDMLHGCLDMVTNAIEDAGGVVVNYMGDGIMAVFNAPNLQPDHAQRAVQAGLNIQTLAKERHPEQRAHNQPLLHFGVGINTGLAIVGNIGAQRHYQYSAIGDSINVASRICSHAPPDAVLIGETTYTELADQITATPLEPIQFKGKSRLMTVYQVTDFKKLVAC